MMALGGVSAASAGDGLNVSGTDLAFQKQRALVGNYNGFAIYDISSPSAPEVIAQVSCPGPQNDISGRGDLVYLSTDSSRNEDSCNSTGQSANVKSSWEGIKIFDISDETNPQYIKSVETKCGSHTHTVVPGEDADYLYVSSYGPSNTAPDCLRPHDRISIVKVPHADPTAASVIATPVLYPEQPKVIETVRDTNFAFWHSATFNSDGSKVIFTDELGGGGSATCNATIGPKRGANAIYDLAANGDLTFKSYYKIPRHQGSTENCVAHNGSIIPVNGRDVMIQSWYQGGVSLWEFTDSANPKELDYFERGAINADSLVLGGTWSAYYYNGFVYSSDITKGLDVLMIKDPTLRKANSVRLGEFNAQTQPVYPIKPGK